MTHAVRPWQWSMGSQDASALQDAVKMRFPLGNRCPLIHVSVALRLLWSATDVAFSTKGTDSQPSATHNIHTDDGQQHELNNIEIPDGRCDKP